MRAWAILMMLQGHFIDGLLHTVFRNPDNLAYTIWLYFRGITAPVFFTVSGFIFTFLLVRVPEQGWQNARVKRGIRRGLQLLLVGYLLRMNLFGLLQGEVYHGFYLVDVLHCIGLSILAIIGFYLFTQKRHKSVFPAILLTTTIFLFAFEPMYKNWSFSFLPDFLANYFTKANGSVFTIIPWLGYAAFGGFLSLLFTWFKSKRFLYPIAITSSTVIGLLLIFLSSKGFFKLYYYTEIQLFNQIQLNNYLFIRLGDVLVVFSIFMLFRKALTNSTILKIGQNTLSIYVIHFIILYGSFTGLGLYRFFHDALNPTLAIFGALAFMVACTALALWYDKKETVIKLAIAETGNRGKNQVQLILKSSLPHIKEVVERLRITVLRIVGLIRN